MGKRKERRLAAAIGAGRRVKLDLFAEPSGDLGGSPAEEVGGGVDSKTDAGLPKSPSSSGQQPANPLLLLGQYSDDDMEVQDSDDNQEDTPTDNDEPIKSNCKEQEARNMPTTEDQSSKKNIELAVEKDVTLGESLQAQGTHITGESNEAGAHTASDEKQLELPQQHDPSVSGLHASGDDAKSCWKTVLHEESNSYYYWNTLTGETSWEVPADFAQVAASTCEPQTQVVEDNCQGSMHASTGTGCATDVSYTLFSSGSKDAQLVQVCKLDESQLNSSSDPMAALHQENVSLGNYSSYVPPSIPIVGGWGVTSSACNVYVHGAVTNNQDGLAAADLPSDLVRRSESLLERLRSLRGCEGNTSQEHAWTSKYISEIEVRLFDLNSLLSCGSVLAPFWLHSERQLKRLEDAINCEIGSYVESELKNDEISSVNLPSYEEGDGKQENVNALADLDEDLKRVVTTSNVVASTEQDAALVQNGTQATQGDSFDETAAVANLNSMPEAPAVEEVDMDVDMEVEDTSLASSPAVMEVAGNHVYPSEQVAEPCSPTGQHILASGDESFAPLDEHFVPPPPPDNEEIPPPPPDDPPEPFCPPLPASYPDPVQPATYSVNYNTVYPDPNYSYYGHTGVSLPNQPVYYDGVSSSQAEAVAALSNSIGSTVFYGLQVAAAPGVPTELTSSFQAASAPSYDTSLPSNLVGSISAQPEMASVQSANVDAYAPRGTAEPINSPASTSSLSAAVSAATKEGVSAPSVSTSAASASLSVMSTVSHSSVAAARPQAKVTRVKKRAVSVASSLRSNKKVSSLVDKWKAAKEELEEAEEEPEDALAVLEKKRQREIEEWRAQQIASGEAKENANFQPLGGDWRERVKRRRAQKVAATGEKQHNNVEEEETVSEKKQPDLTKHTKGLPPGWQAYWDESSKQVYYGNTITSETSWTRPA